MNRALMGGRPRPVLVVECDEPASERLWLDFGPPTRQEIAASGDHRLRWPMRSQRAALRARRDVEHRKGVSSARISYDSAPSGGPTIA